MLTFDAYLSVLDELQSDFAAAAVAADATTPVPACDGWTVADLVEHLAGVHRWAAGMARQVRGERLTPPVDVTAYAAEAAEVRRTLAELGPDATGRILNGLSPDNLGPVSFWVRRQVHETLIHLDDLTSATGIAMRVWPPQLWADTIDEVLTVMYARQVALGREPVVPAVALVAADADAVYLLGEGEAAAEVRGPARDLALLLWRRRSLSATGLVVTGDHAALDTALAQPLVP